ncbi:hypothetical protein ACFLYJ_03605 [Candidatus Cloacimonadota bacterium]
MRRRNLLILMILFVFLKLWGAGHSTSYYHETNIVYRNGDTLHCYLIIPSFIKPPNTNHDFFVENGTDIKPLLKTLQGTYYIIEYQNFPGFGFLAADKDFHYLSLNDSAINKIIYIKKMQELSSSNVQLASDYLIPNIENKPIISTYVDYGDGWDEMTYYNFDPEVNKNEFKYIIQSYNPNINPFEYPAFERKTGFKFINDLSSIKYSNHNDINPLQFLSNLIETKEKVLLEIKDIKPKHVELINSIIEMQEQIIGDLKSMHDLFESKYTMTNDNSETMKLNKKLADELVEMYDRYEEIWRKEINNQEENYKNFKSSYIYRFVDKP